MEEQREERAKGPHRPFILSVFVLYANPKLLSFVATIFFFDLPQSHICFVALTGTD